MGTSYYAAIVVGLPENDFPDKEKLEIWKNEYPSVIDANPYYPDCWGEDENMICGVAVYTSGGYDAEPFIYDQQKIDEAIVKFKEYTGLTPNVYLTPRIW